MVEARRIELRSIHASCQASPCSVILLFSSGNPSLTEEIRTSRFQLSKAHTDYIALGNPLSVVASGAGIDPELTSRLN